MPSDIINGRGGDSKPGDYNAGQNHFFIFAYSIRHGRVNQITMKIVFVGIHNKPGLKPLCSSTKTGEIIDTIISMLPPDYLIFEKKNLFPVDYLPSLIQERKKFLDEFVFESDAYYITLGKIVSDCFDGLDVNFFPVHHPGYICRFSQSTQMNYINQIVQYLKNIGQSALARV